uniref:cell division protein FtsX n=1 Tax=Alloprevotella sp. TaxID=1872471 RepID=UPI003FEEE62D
MSKPHKKRRTRGHFGAITTCISTTLVLVLLGIVVLFVSVGDNYSRQLREGFTVEVMLNDSIQPVQQSTTLAALRKAPYAREVNYISKEQGMREMNDVMGGDLGTFDGTSPVPAEFEVFLNYDYANADSLARYEKAMLALPGVSEVNYPRDIMQSLDRTIPAIGLGLLIVAGLLALVSFSLINNIIRMSVYARRYSIHTMKLVGASWAFIRRPFIVQALRIGIVAAIIACGLLGGMIYYLQFEAGAGDIYINQLITPEVWIYTLGVIVVCGICLTAWSAYLSVNHHLSLRGGEVYVR